MEIDSSILITKAQEVRLNSYSPYSKFKVGAALLTESGNIYTGCNVENASFGGTICAERGAAMSAIASEGPKTRFVALAVVSQGNNPASPCGICRQFLSEFMGSETPVYLYSVDSKIQKTFSFGQLLPESFTEF